MLEFREVQPHGQIQEIFRDIFMVTGTNKIHHGGIDIQTSRNMIIVRENHDLSLINTVRLDEEGLAALNNLGHIKNIVRIGAFHGYDDAFYLHCYPDAKLWAIAGMEHQNSRKSDMFLSNSVLPISHCSLFHFVTTKHPEAILILKHEAGNILITCDSIQNWVHKDEFMSEATFERFKESGLIKQANIPETWINECKPEPTELWKLKTLEFKHLLSAHGEPLKNDAYEAVCKTLEQKFKNS